MENSKELSRRSFLKKSTGAAAGASAFTIIKPELVRGAGNEKLKAGLVGCGGRGTEAAQQILHGNENVELIAMGDIFEDKLETSLDKIQCAFIVVRYRPDPHAPFVLAATLPKQFPPCHATFRMMLGRVR